MRNPRFWKLHPAVGHLAEKLAYSLEKFMRVLRRCQGKSGTFKKFVKPLK
jgi:hypothetical protein